MGDKVGDKQTQKYFNILPQTHGGLRETILSLEVKARKGLGERGLCLLVSHFVSHSSLPLLLVSHSSLPPSLAPCFPPSLAPCFLAGFLVGCSLELLFKLL